MRCYYFVLTLVLVIALGLPAMSPAQDYILGSGDLLKITVYGNDDLTTVARVSGEGKVSFPLAGEIKIDGLSVREVEQKITKVLADGLIIDPHVSVFVQEYRSKKVTILGEVKKPGLYELNGSVTLLEMISRAEGLTESAGDTILVQRTKPDGQSLSISLKELMEKGDAASNISLQDGDSVFVAKSGFVYVLGEVQKPGAYKVDRDTTVMKAVALAGGFTPKASPGRTVIIRKSGSGEEKFKANMSVKVITDDVISVPESFF